MRIAGIERESFVDGEGIRYVIFTQGCTHHCKGCHNPQTWDFNGGKEISIDELLEDFEKNKDLLDGITLSGGDPLYQPYDTACFILEFKERYPDMSIWLYTGYTIERMIEEIEKYHDWDILNILENIDMLVDGPFILDQRDLSLNFRGSSNQRLIDKETIQRYLKPVKVKLEENIG